MRYLKKFIPVTTICVFLTIIFYTIVTHYIIPLIPKFKDLGFVINIFASIGFYLSIFYIFLWIYYRFIEDILNPKDAIVGEWFYKLEISGKESDPRYGICEINKHRGELSVTGIHYSPTQKKFTSRFNSNFVLIEGNNLIIVYNSVGVDEEIFRRNGVYFLSTESVPPQRIYGVWTDILPSRNSGDIVMQKRDKSIDSIFDKIGYPKDSIEFKKLFNITDNIA